MHSVITALLLISISSAGFAQSWEQVHPAWEVNAMHHMIHWNGDTVFACGNEWTLLRSVDAGETWEEMFKYTNGKNIESLTTDGREIYFYIRVLTNGAYDLDRFPITAYNPYTGALREITLPAKVQANLYSAYQLRATPGCLYVFDRQGTNAKLYKSNNGGRTWDARGLPGDAVGSEWANTIHFITDDIGFIICGDTLNVYNRVMYRTEDGGESWTKLTGKYPREEIAVKHVIRDGKITTYMAIALQVYKSTDSCKSWEITGNIPWSSPTYPGVDAMDFSASGIGFVAGKQSDIYATIDGGDSWAQVKEATALNGTTGLLVLDNGIIFTCNFPGHFYRSDDRGVTWKSLRMPLFHSVRAFAFKDAMHGVVVAADESGVIYSYYSSDGGAYWSQGIFLLDFYNLDSVNVAVNTSVILGGDTIQFFRQESLKTGLKGAIHRLSDMGTKLEILKVWDIGTCPEGTYSAYEGMHFVKGDSGTAYSYDDGKTWAFSKITDTLNTKSGIHFATDDNDAVVAYCYNQYADGTRIKKAAVYKSMDSCKSWVAVLPPTDKYDVVFELDVIAPNVVIIRVLGNANETMLHTSDGGEHWNEIATAPALGLSETIYTGNAAYALYGSFMTLHKSSDKWKTADISFNYYGLASGRLFFADENHGWIVANYVIFRTTNGGVNWVQQPFTVREDAAITAIYPNPVMAGQSAAVNIQIPPQSPLAKGGRQTPLRVHVYDLLGRTVATLYNGPADPGIRTLRWQPAPSLPAGMYVVRMSHGENVWAKQLAVVR